MAEKKEAKATVPVAENETGLIVPEPVMTDTKGEVKPVSEVIGDVKVKDDERIVFDKEAKPVVRQATAAEMGTDMNKEDSLKFVPPTAPSNAAQPDTYIEGVRTEMKDEK